MRFLKEKESTQWMYGVPARVSRQTVTRCVEGIAEKMEQQLKDKVKDFTYFSLALDESSDARDTAQLLIFLWGITPDFEITEELASVQSMKSTTTGKDFMEEVNNCVAKLGLSFEKLSSVTTDGCPNLTGKKRWSFEKNTRSSSWAEPRSENYFPALYYSSGAL